MNKKLKQNAKYVAEENGIGCVTLGDQKRKGQETADQCCVRSWNEDLNERTEEREMEANK